MVPMAAEKKRSTQSSRLVLLTTSSQLSPGFIRKGKPASMKMAPKKPIS
jgi:hypothetical protein